MAYLRGSNLEVGSQITTKTGGIYQVLGMNSTYAYVIGGRILLSDLGTLLWNSGVQEPIINTSPSPQKALAQHELRAGVVSIIAVISILLWNLL